MSPTQRWKLRRNLAIYTLSKAGWSQRQLADVFDLVRSRVAAIITEVGDMGGAPEIDRGQSDRGARVLNSMRRKCRANTARPRE